MAYRNLVNRMRATTAYRYIRWDDGTIVDYPDVSGVMLGSRKWQGGLVQGDHVSPTFYRAHRYSATPGYFKVLGPPYRGYLNGKWQYSREVIEGVANLPNQHLGGLDGEPWDYRFPSHLDSSARTNLLNALKGDSADIAVIAGEMPEAVRMTHDLVIGVLRIIRAIKSGNNARVQSAVKDAIMQASWNGRKPVSSAALKRIYKSASIHNKRDVLRRVANTTVTRGPSVVADMWLAYSFGWKPMVYDIAALANDIIGPDGKGKTFALSRTRTASSLMTSSDATYKVSGGGVKGTTVKAVYRLDNPATHQLHKSGLGNPASVAWELLPMSFLIDYLVPIGQALSAVSGHYGLTYLHGYETRFGYGNLTITRPGYMVPYNGEEVSPATWKINTFGMQRMPTFDWPAPSLSIRSGITSNQGLNVLALLIKNKS